MNTLPVVSYDIVSAFTSCLKRYVKFSGRACRSEYWFWCLATFLIGFVIGLLVVALPLEVVNMLSNVLTLVFFLPGLAVAVRRLHDAGHSAWSLLWLLLPVIGWIILLVYYCKPSVAPNQYGEGPATPEA